MPESNSKTQLIKKYNLDSKTDLAEFVQSEKNHRIAVNQAKIAFWRWSFIEEKMTHWSDEYKIIDAMGVDLQTSDEDMLKPVLEEDRDRVDKIYTDAYENEHGYDVDYRIVDSDGSIR